MIKINPWLFNKNLDLAILYAPVWICWLVAFLLPQSIIQQESPLWIWIVFVIGIDVSHVWSTIFRTYTDKEEFNQHRKLLIYAPIACFILAFLIASISFHFFWRCLAYLAVFHFVKQQYGFMRIYKAKARDFRKKLFNDNWVIYLSMLYPILFWHLDMDRSFSWFVEGDFIQIHMNSQVLYYINFIGTALYLLILLGWLIEEIILKDVSIPKILWVLTTAGNWFIGIIYFNSDLIFTITNVIAHGVPYMALVIFYQNKKESIKHVKRSIPLIATVLIGVFFLAFFEEYLWDMLVYRDNVELFTSLFSYPFFENTQIIQHLGLALLAVPQTTHYVLDGFIWKNNEKNPYLKKALFN